jgi:hypothetical protein
MRPSWSFWKNLIELVYDFLGKCLWLDQLQGRLVEAAFPGQRRAAGHALHGSFAETLGRPKVVKGPIFMKMGVKPMQDMVTVCCKETCFCWCGLNWFWADRSCHLWQINITIFLVNVCVLANLRKPLWAIWLRDSRTQIIIPIDANCWSKCNSQGMSPCLAMLKSLSVHLCTIYIYAWHVGVHIYIYTYTCTYFYLSNYFLDKCLMQVV